MSPVPWLSNTHPRLVLKVFCPPVRALQTNNIIALTTPNNFTKAYTKVFNVARTFCLLQMLRRWTRWQTRLCMPNNRMYLAAFMLHVSKWQIRKSEYINAFCLENIPQSSKANISQVFFLVCPQNSKIQVLFYHVRMGGSLPTTARRKICSVG